MHRLLRPLSLSLFVGLVLYCLPSLRAMTQESAAGEPARTRSYTLTTGDTLHGTILESEGDRVRLKLKILGGSSERWYEISHFQPKSQVRLKHEMVADGDVLAQLAVAEFAADLGLYDQARVELKRCAYMAKESEAPQSEQFKDRAVALTVKLLQDHCNRGEIAAARAGVTRILAKHGEALTQEQQSLLLHTVEFGAEKHQAAKDAKRRSKEDAKLTAEREKKLAPIHKHIDQGKALRRSGLLKSRQYGAARRELSRAIDHFDDALEEIEKIRKDHPDDPVMSAELDAAFEEAKGMWQDTLLSRSSLALANGQFNDAMEGVNTILADSPHQEQALAMRGRIEVAQNDWGW